MESRPLAGLSTFQFLAFFRRGLFYSFLSIYLYYYLGLSITYTSFFVTFSMIASAIGQSFIWGRLADKLFNRKKMVFISEIIAAAGHIIVWTLHRVAFDNYSRTAAAWTIILGLTCIEFFWSASNVAWSSLISDIVPQEQRSSTMGRLSGIGGFGRIFGVLCATIFLSVGGFRGGGFYYGDLFFITAFVISTTAIVILVTISDKDLTYRYESHEISKTNSKAKVDLKFFLIFLLALACINFGRNAINAIQDYFLIDKFNVTDAGLGIYEGLRGVFTVVAGFSTPLLVKKFNDWKIFLISPVFVIFCFIIFVFSPIVELAFLFGSMIWIAQVTINASSYGIISSKIPSNVRGRYFGYFNTAFFLSFGFGTTFLTGPISDYLISLHYTSVFAYSVSYFAASILILIGLVIALYLFDYSKNDLSKPLNG